MLRIRRWLATIPSTGWRGKPQTWRSLAPATAANPMPANLASGLHMPRWAVGLVWLTVCLSVILDTKVPLGDSGRVINLSLFDIAVPACLAAVWASGRTGRPELSILAALGGALGLVLLHSGVSYWLDPVLEPVGLARETVKVAAAGMLLAMLLSLFAAPALRDPPIWLLCLILLVVAVDALGQRYHELRGGAAYAETLDANTIFGLFVVLAAVLSRRADPPRRAIAAGAALAVVFVMIVMFSKAYVAMAIAAMVLLIAWCFLGSRPPRHMAVIGTLLAGALCGVGVVALVLWFAGTGFTYFPIGSIGKSLSLRLDLWDFAWRLAVANFPWGTGLGQYGALVMESPELRPLGLRYVHNTPLALLTELGALGLLLVAGLAYLVYLACRSWPWPIAWSFAIFLIPPLMLHDALGLRMSILVLALGISEGMRADLPAAAREATPEDRQNPASNR